MNKAPTTSQLQRWHLVRLEILDAAKLLRTYPDRVAHEQAMRLELLANGDLDLAAAQPGSPPAPLAEESQS